MGDDTQRSRKRLYCFRLYVSSWFDHPYSIGLDLNVKLFNPTDRVHLRCYAFAHALSLHTTPWSSGHPDRCSEAYCKTQTSPRESQSRREELSENRKGFVTITPCAPAESIQYRDMPSTVRNEGLIQAQRLANAPVHFEPANARQYSPDMRDIYSVLILVPPEYTMLSN